MEIDEEVITRLARDAVPSSFMPQIVRTVAHDPAGGIVSYLIIHWYKRMPHLESMWRRCESC